MERITQEDRILRHLKQFGSITSLESFREYGVTRLSAVIYNLKHHYGIDFDEEWVTKKNRYGENTTFKKYILKPKEEK